ncbi:hypothetical protein [Paenibacillus elgii]|uniref:hypothetical protein n=1 Tax=Paenibacillus elgii TaxID=189691 RepID=UPI000A475294|nr:hypothetical protein [Paenibacillus elgii]
MRRLLKLWKEQSGAVSIYLIIILVPLFLLCGLLIDVARWKTADKEAENAVKSGVRSTLSAFSPKLAAYGLFGTDLTGSKGDEIFKQTVAGNLSGAAEPGQFRFIDQRLEEDSAKVTPIFALSSHTIFKQQILEEMKYRAPMIYALELTDKFKKTGLDTKLNQASKFAENAIKVEELLEERDRRLDEAWDAFQAIRQKSEVLHPHYDTQLRDLNALSEKIGIHTLENIRASLQSAQATLKALNDQIKQIDGSIMSLIQGGTGAADSIRQLNQTKNELQRQAAEAGQKVAEFQQLLDDFTKYAALLGLLKGEAALDDAVLSKLKDAFLEAMKLAKKANDDLNTEISKVRQPNGSGQQLKAEDVFNFVQLIDRQELEEWEAGVGTAVAQFSSVRVQLEDNLMFTKQKYSMTIAALNGFKTKVDEWYAKQNKVQTERQNKNKATAAAKREQRAKAQPILDEFRRTIGSCSLVSNVDPYEESYRKLQGDPKTAGSKGFYQTYLEMNQAAGAISPVSAINLKTPDQAGSSSLKLVSALEGVLTDVRDEFYIDEYAVSKFSYRTLGLEKDASGRPQTSKELSNPAGHALTNQEVEYLIYGSTTCSGNYSSAYAEMFAVRLAIGTTEALLEPRNEVLAAGSPLLVLLAAVTEGAIRAQADMMKLVQGEQVPLSQKLSGVITLGYKDYLRLFLLLHSRESVLLSRMQALIELNTQQKLYQMTTYVSGGVTTSYRLWFLPAIMKMVGKSGFSGCEVSGNRCRMTKTADFTY